MASSKYYAYYIRGRQVAIVQHDYTLGSGQTLSQPGLNSVGARGDVLWKSPTESVLKGIEIEYAYSPRHTVTASHVLQQNKFWFNGWIVDGGYLTFVRGRLQNASHTFNNMSSSPYSAMGVDEYISVHGSSRWNGIHKVQSVTTGATDGGKVKTYTKVKDIVAPPRIDGSANITATNLNSYRGKAASGIYMSEMGFSIGDWILVDTFPENQNNGIKRISNILVEGNDETLNSLVVDDQLAIFDGVDSGYSQTHLMNEEWLHSKHVPTVDLTTTSANRSANMYKFFRDHCYIISDVDVLSDETDEIDLPEYLAKALVYYVKAKVAEDRMELEQKEYNMREFKRLLERNENSKIWGARRIGTDESAIK